MARGDRLPGKATLREKVAYLSRPSTFGDPAGGVEVKETHMSWVFLAGDRVYKLRKPVRYPFLDFSTLAAREIDCHAEIRLNQRLAPDVYLGVVRLTRRANGTLALDDGGVVVDWLVVMRRLPESRMLDSAIVRGTVTRGQVERLAELLAGFYRGLGPAEVSEEEYLDRFARQHVNNRALLEDGRFGLPGDGLDAMLSNIEKIIAREPELLTDRVTAGRVVEGHGDLRPEHVCLAEPPVVIDCLEFNRALRLVDPFDELADLAMECERLGAPWIGEILMSRCAQALDDRPPDRLVAFYTAYRGCVRARLALAHLLDSTVRDPDRWRPLAAEYLALAERASLSLRPPGAPPGTRLRGSAESPVRTGGRR